MKEKQSAGPYHIAGYSFGACVAFEMCLQLEASSIPIGSVNLLDGSHAYVAAHTGHYKARITPGDKARIETEALCAFTLQFAATDYIKVCFTFWSCKRQVYSSIFKHASIQFKFLGSLFKISCPSYSLKKLLIFGLANIQLN